MTRKPKSFEGGGGGIVTFGEKVRRLRLAATETRALMEVAP